MNPSLDSPSRPDTSVGGDERARARRGRCGERAGDENNGGVGGNEETTEVQGMRRRGWKEEAGRGERIR
jgi:hypothetical protein